MGWVEDIGKAIQFIEENLTQPLTLESIAKRAFVSSFYFQKGFALLCGFTVSEYIRQRRLTLAGIDLLSGGEKIIDIALKYGYESPDSFTKAFTRFHGATPTAVRKGGAMVKAFAPLKIKLILEGGSVMDYKIVEKEAFAVLGASRLFPFDTAKEEIPRFWAEHYKAGRQKTVCGMYGICIDEGAGPGLFEYLIADECAPAAPIPKGFVAKTIPAHTWAVFACTGAMPKALQEVNDKIFSEWLPSCTEYEIAAGYNIEMYTDINNYPQGNQRQTITAKYGCPLGKRKIRPGKSKVAAMPILCILFK